MHLQDTTISLRIFLISTLLCLYTPLFLQKLKSTHIVVYKINPGFVGRGGVLKDSQGIGLMAFQCILILTQIMLQNYRQLDKVYQLPGNLITNL